jgi:hypothetical protein
MSKFVKISTQLRDVALVKKALDDLKISYRENARYVHVWSGFSGDVPLVVQGSGVTVGLRSQADGTLEVLADDMQMARVRPLMQQVQQRYAYHSVLEATAAAGFDLVEEAVGADKVIRLTVRRWA